MTAPASQAGMALIEVLVAMLIVAFGALGFGGAGRGAAGATVRTAMRIMLLLPNSRASV